MTSEVNALTQLEGDQRLLNPVVRGESSKVPGRLLFRGELVLKKPEARENEKRPPELKADQVILATSPGDSKLEFAAFYLLSFASLSSAAELLASMMLPSGRYLAFCNNIDLGTAYLVPFGEFSFHVLPLDESTVYNELLELVRIEKNDVKKLDAVGKLDAIVTAASKKLYAKFERITYERGLELMGPVRNPGEHRPV
jgi:hypothetical protein